MTLLRVVVVALVAILWVLVGSRDLCPSCGVELEDASLDQRAVGALKADHCRWCGWRRRR